MILCFQRLIRVLLISGCLSVVSPYRHIERWSGYWIRIVNLHGLHNILHVYRIHLVAIAHPLYTRILI